MSPRNFSALARSQLTAHANALSILGLLFLGVFIALPAFSPGILMGWDSPGHLVKTQFLVEALLPNGQWNGWFPYWHSGFGLFDLYPPGFYVFAALLHFASMGLLSVSAAFKLAAILAFALVAPASYLLLRSFGVSRLGAVFGGIFSLLVGGRPGGGIVGTFGVGLVPNALGLALLAAFLAAFNHALEKKERRAQAVAALAFGALMLTHAFSAYVALMLCVLLVGMRLVRGNTRWPELVWVCGILVAGFLASAFWWAPAFFSFDGRGYILGWLTPTLHGLISGILSGELVGSLAVSLLGVAGLGLAVVRRKTEDLFLALAAVLLLWLSMGQASFLPLLDAAMSAQSVRFLGPFVLVWAFLAALTVDVFVRAGVNWNRGPWKRFTPFFIASVMIAVLAVAVPPVFDVANAHIRTGSDFSALADVDAAMQWIAANTPSSARFVTEYHEVVQGVYGTPYGSPHVLSQFLPLYANRASVTGNFPEGSPSSFGSVLFSAYLAERPESVRSDFIRYGVSHALAYAPQTVQRLRATFGYELVFEQGAVAVFRLTDAPVHPFRAPAGASVLSFEESPTEWRSRMASEQGAMVNVAVTFHPNWRAYVDGTPVALEKSGDNLMRFFLPAGAHAVRLVYVPPGYSAPLLAFGLLVFTALVSVAFGRKTQDTA